jgi:hypothetical protein
MIERTIAYLEQTKADYVREIAGLTEAQWRFKTSPQCWSVAECAEHLAMVEDFLFGRIQAMKDAPPAPLEEIEKIKGREEVILRAVPVRNGRRAEAPERVRPTNRWPDPESLIAHFTELRDRTIAYARTAGEELRTHTFPHFVFGPLDGFQWMMFLAAHTERHLLQAGELKAHPDFPK